MMEKLERGVYRRFVDVLSLSRLRPRPSLDARGGGLSSDGQLLVPVTIDAERLSLSLAMRVAHHCGPSLSAQRLQARPDTAPAARSEQESLCLDRDLADEGMRHADSGEA